MLSQSVDPGTDLAARRIIVEPHRPGHRLVFGLGLDRLDVVDRPHQDQGHQQPEQSFRDGRMVGASVAVLAGPAGADM